MRAYERFLEYVKVFTTSDPDNETDTPTTRRQFDLACLLAAEMKAMGIVDAYADEHGYVYGHIPPTPGCEGVPALGFLAHMDTSPDAPGEGVAPLLHENYDGGDVRLPSGHVIPAQKFPLIQMVKGETLITADGSTLLGADDKAGIAEILTLCEELLQSGRPHGPLCIAFTPDEEVGRGVDKINLEALGAQYAYTVDGGPVYEIEYESFNAADAKVYFSGVSVHPGSAKDIMVNAAKLAIEFNALLPPAECPEKTEEREGFYHLHSMQGNVEEAALHYILRDHDRGLFEQRKAALQSAAAEMQARYGQSAVRLVIKDSYYNMGEVVQQHFHLVENACEAVRKAGCKPEIVPIRGGTDGSRLSFMGLPCPNIGTGGLYPHGPSECISVQQMDKVVEVLHFLVQAYATFVPPVE